MECETGAQSHGVGVYGDGELGSAMGLACRENWGLACPAVGCEELGNKNARGLGCRAGMHGARDLG